MKEDHKVQKWIRWLNILSKEMQEILLYKDVFFKTRQIVENNPKIQKPSVFYEMISDGYAAIVLSGIRRQVKPHKDAVSLIQLLSEIQENPQLLTRSRYVKMHKGSVVEDQATYHFNYYANPTDNYINPALVTKDIEQLKQSALSCEEFADKRLAHTDHREPKKIPTHTEVNNALEILEEMHNKYRILLTAKGWAIMTPVIQYDWMKIFQDAWLPDDEPANYT